MIDRLLYPSTTHILIITNLTDNISSTNIQIWQHSSQSVTSCPSVCHPLSAACYTWPLAERRSHPLRPPGTAVSSGWGPGGTPPHSDLASWPLTLPPLPLLHAVKIKRRFNISIRLVKGNYLNLDEILIFLNNTYYMIQVCNCASLINITQQSKVSSKNLALKSK